jgi:hypothetical protein
MVNLQANRKCWWSFVRAREAPRGRLFLSASVTKHHMKQSTSIVVILLQYIIENIYSILGHSMAHGSTLGHMRAAQGVTVGLMELNEDAPFSRGKSVV